MHREIQQFRKLQAEGQILMWAPMSQLNLAARGYQRVPKLARITADLGGLGDPDRIPGGGIAPLVAQRG